MDRKTILKEAKKLGLPARGTTKILSEKIKILKTHPLDWSKLEFELIMNDLSIHQDFREGAIERVELILNQGLNSGMVDSLGNMVTGRCWTFSRGLIGKPAYIFVSGALEYRGKSNPYLKPGNKPLFAILPSSIGQDIFEAIRSSSTQKI
ncbi:MAG: hypothetical protein PSV17_05575 [Methylotenera sp.]|uniref:hypothetical protein n=1 Tax=Methylotenera sp. TaxID=2051956 RepID=UPI0024876D1C|nr:hypothetical protein [Methylotenera sp.]MDI1308887.1 hypothetical protein [Methylotenera sp.]